jgi:hypothetical protein
MIREVLERGAIRMAGASGAFVYERVRPGVYLTSFRGRDNGEFGAAPLEIIAQEYRFFERPVEWFFDASLAENPRHAVSEEWTLWLRHHQSVLSRMHVLTAGQETHLRISVARHFSDSLKQMQLYTDRAKWQQAFLLCSPGYTAVPGADQRFTAAALDVDRVESREAGVRLSAPGSQWTFRRLPNGVVFTTFTGDDDGVLTNDALNEMQVAIEKERGKVSWFLDLREARNVATHVSQTWTAWLSAHRNRLARVTVLSPSPLFPLVLTVAKYRSGSERLFHIHREVQPFREELVSLASPELAIAVGV